MVNTAEETERVVVRSARGSSSSAAADLLHDRIVGRIRSILDKVHLAAITVPTVLGKVLIQYFEEEKAYRVALKWPERKLGPVHDYTFSGEALRRMDHSAALVIDGLVSAATKSVLEWQKKKGNVEVLN